MDLRCKGNERSLQECKMHLEPEDAEETGSPRSSSYKKMPEIVAWMEGFRSAGAICNKEGKMPLKRGRGKNQ